LKAGVAPAAGKGRGVFAETRIRCGEVIDSSPVIAFPKSQWKYINKTVLHHYCYFWGETFEDGAVVLGLGSLYNHSYEPNAMYVHHLDELTMDYVAIKDIEQGEEITINYNGSPDDRSPVWFDVLP
jgi:SET domain-containing protein